MKHANGELLLRNSLNGTQAEENLTWREALILLGLGAGAVILHAILRWSLKLPGHHGLEWMALLIIARSTSQHRWAASLSSAGASVLSVLPVWGFGDPFIWLIYFLPGLMIDVGFNLKPRWQDKAWFLASLGGLAHATKPLVRLLISLVSGWPYGSLLYGLAYPLATHIVFGFLGGALGAGIIMFSRRCHC